jgi:hypothetical protein
MFLYFFTLLCRCISTIWIISKNAFYTSYKLTVEGANKTTNRPSKPNSSVTMCRTLNIGGRIEGKAQDWMKEGGRYFTANRLVFIIYQSEISLKTLLLCLFPEASALE